MILIIPGARNARRTAYKWPARLDAEGRGGGVKKVAGRQGSALPLDNARSRVAVD